jgi:HlyD family secretion protein
MKQILKYLLFIGLGVLFIWTMYFLYQKSASAPDEFTIEKLKRNNVVKKTVANGKIVPRKEIMIKPVVSGIISELFVEAGDIVTKDQPLAKIQIVPDMLSAEQRREPAAQRRDRSTERPAQLRPQQAVGRQGVISAAEMQTYRHRPAQCQARGGALLKRHCKWCAMASAAAVRATPSYAAPSLA